MAQETKAKTKATKAKTVPAKQTAKEVAEKRKKEAEKKARQRAEKRACGLREITVWCLPEQAQQVRDFADSLPRPPEGSTPEQVQRFRDDQFPILKAINEANDKEQGQSDGQASFEY